jgi:hypothetical protein
VTVTLLLVTSGTINLNLYLMGRSDGTWNHRVQDIFFVGLGLVALNGGLWITSGLSRYFNFFISKINDLGHLVSIADPAAHQALIQYFHVSGTGFVLFLDILVTRQRVCYVVMAFLQCLGIGLYLFNS